MGEPAGPADGVTSSEGDIEDVAAGRRVAESSEEQAATPSPPAADHDGAAGETTVPGTWSRRHRVRLGIGVATVAVLMVVVVGGIAIASGAGDHRSSPPGDSRGSTTTAPPAPSTTASTSTTTTLAPTTAPPAAPTDEPTSEPAGTRAADDGIMTPVTPPSPAVPVCGPGPWGLSHPQGPVPGPPDQAILVDGPNNYCSNGASGCEVSISTTWSDGVTASDSRVLTVPGTHTLYDGRGTTATFSVSPDLACAFNGAEFSYVWPGGT